jgi:energy-coupling factor transport system permease protein
VTARGLAPGPLLALTAAACAIGFTIHHPLVAVALALGAVALIVATPGRGKVPFAIAAVVGAGTALLNPFVQSNGDLILVELPGIPVLDTQVTIEEVVAGAVIGANAAAVTLVVCAVLLLIDPDRLLAAARRIAPGSALTTAIAARMLPTLTRDARGMHEAMSLRGRAVGAGSARRRARAAAALAVPLLASGLERSLDVAEAMAARGFGAGPRTRVREAPYGRADWMRLALAAAMAGVFAAALLTDLDGYRFYPTLDAILTVPAAGVAGATAGVLLATAWGARR